ncbi:MAG: DUF488 domain-containing protein [Steroidobacteraceae bacterium]
MATRRTRRAGAAYSSPPCYLHEAESGAAPSHGVQIKRIYDARDPADGYRALVDRLWPRGISKARAALDAWLVELAPSTELRQWFGHEPGRFAEFARRYRAELRAQRHALDELRARAARERVTLLYAARDPRSNHATVLRDVLLKRARDAALSRPD